MSQEQTTRIENVTTIDAAGNVIRGRTVTLQGGVIAAIEEAPRAGVADSAASRRREGGAGQSRVNQGAAWQSSHATGADNKADEAVRVIDGSSLFLSPSLINMHTHLAMNIFKGIAEDVSVDAWFNEEIWPYESKMTGDDIRVGARLAMGECLQAGVSAAADHYFQAELLCEESITAGMRLDMAPTLFGLAGEYDAQLDRAAEVVQEWDGRNGTIQVRLGPHAPYTCDPGQLRRTAERAAKLGVGAHIHASESAAQVESSLKEHGKTPLEVISESGLLEVGTILAHGVFFTAGDRQLLLEVDGGGAVKAGLAGTEGGKATGRRRKPAMVLCPKTYQKLGTGFGHPLNDIASWPVTIGSDGAASSNSLNPVEQARLLGLWAKERTGTGEALPAREIWKILMRGHEVLDFGSGKLEAGAPADLILWDLEDPATQPVYDPLTAIIYSSHPGNVSYLWVNGRLRKMRGKLLLDMEPVYQEARARVGALLSRGKGKSKLLY